MPQVSEVDNTLVSCTLLLLCILTFTGLHILELKRRPRVGVLSPRHLRALNPRLEDAAVQDFITQICAPGGTSHLCGCAPRSSLWIFCGLVLGR